MRTDGSMGEVEVEVQVNAVRVMQARCSNGFEVPQERSVAVLDPHSGAPDASIEPYVGARASLR